MERKDWTSFEVPWQLDEKLLLEDPPVEKVVAADWAALNPAEAAAASLSRMSEENLRKLVLGALDNTLYLSDQLRDMKQLPMVFLPIALGALADWPLEKLAEIGGFYAPFAQALPRSINGLPCFPCMTIVHKDDWSRALQAIYREMARRSEIVI